MREYSLAELENKEVNSGAQILGRLEDSLFDAQGVIPQLYILYDIVQMRHGIFRDIIVFKLGRNKILINTVLHNFILCSNEDEIILNSKIKRLYFSDRRAPKNSMYTHRNTVSDILLPNVYSSNLVIKPNNKIAQIGYKIYDFAKCEPEIVIRFMTLILSGAIMMWALSLVLMLTIGFGV